MRVLRMFRAVYRSYLVLRCRGSPLAYTNRTTANTCLSDSGEILHSIHCRELR